MKLTIRQMLSRLIRVFTSGQRYNTNLNGRPYFIQLMPEQKQQLFL